MKKLIIIMHFLGGGGLYLEMKLILFLSLNPTIISQVPQPRKRLILRGSCQQIVTNFSLVIRSHPFVGIYFVNNGTNIVSFEMIRTKKNILSKCFCSVTHGVYYFTTLIQLC